MNFLIVFLLSLPLLAAKIDEGPSFPMKWITVNFEKAQGVTLKGKLKVEKDCNQIGLQNQRLSRIAHDKYLMTVDQLTTTMGCPDTKKTIAELDLQTFSIANEKRNSVMLLVPAGANFSVVPTRP
ncbi:MAG: hypothetical protein ACJ76H_16885 [Bacteriovoracaceae bacterium]